MDFYGDDQRALQDRFETRPLADTLEAAIVSDSIDDEAKAFIESRDFFFLSTVDRNGHPTVSHKGGPVGMVQVLDEHTLLFPSYDGNGMFLSMGNIAGAAKIGMLFIDFETPHRIRVQATAEVSDDAAFLARFPGAELVVRATIDATFRNCPRYIHKHERVETSRFVPDGEGQAPLPSWKKIDALQPVLAPKDQGRAEAEGDLISGDEYAERIKNGTT